jgi:hypothetical protein
MPDIATAFGLTPIFALIGTVNFPQNPLSRGNLIGAHHQQSREAFNQVHRYSKESFNADNSLYKYLQIFVISNGTDSR